MQCSYLPWFFGESFENCRIQCFWNLFGRWRVTHNLFLHWTSFSHLALPGGNVVWWLSPSSASFHKRWSYIHRLSSQNISSDPWKLVVGYPVTGWWRVGSVRTYSSDLLWPILPSSIYLVYSVWKTIPPRADMSVCLSGCVWLVVPTARPDVPGWLWFLSLYGTCSFQGTCLG